MTAREPERTATAAELADERAKLDRAASGAWQGVSGHMHDSDSYEECSCKAELDARIAAEESARIPPRAAYEMSTDRDHLLRTWPQQPAPVPPHVSADDLGRNRCEATSGATGAGYICTAEAGHIGPHAAYAGPGDLCHTWRQEPAWLPTAAELEAAAEPHQIRMARESLAEYRELQLPGATEAGNWRERAAACSGHLAADLAALVRAWEDGELND